MGDDEGDEVEKKPPTDINGYRYFYSKAFLLPIERNLYGLFRDCLMEDVKTGAREKTGRVGPIRILRPKKPSDPPAAVRIRSVHPKTGKELDLVEYDG